MVAFPRHTLGFGSRSLAKSHPSNNVSSMEERVDAGEANPGMVEASMEPKIMLQIELGNKFKNVIVFFRCFHSE